MGRNIMEQIIGKDCVDIIYSYVHKLYMKDLIKEYKGMLYRGAVNGYHGYIMRMSIYNECKFNRSKLGKQLAEAMKHKHDSIHRYVETY